MAELNYVLLIGNLTRDPELRYTPSGTPVVDLRLAVNRRFRQGEEGAEREETCYVDVTVWRRQAETVNQYLRKGSPVFVEGRLKYDEWERDGQKRSRLSVVAHRVQFLSGVGGNRESGGEDVSSVSSRPGRGASGAGLNGAPAEPPSSAGESGGADPAAADDDNLPF